MVDFFYRTEALRLEEIKQYFVETREDRKILEQLKARNPVLLVGSRGVGKSFLLRKAEDELLEDFHEQRILPVYVTFRKSSLIHTNDKKQFQHWMIARICNEILRVLRKNGELTSLPDSLSILTGKSGQQFFTEKTQVEKIAEFFEESWKNQNHYIEVDIKELPSTDTIIEAIEDICIQLELKRIVLFIDEAAHIFMPEQQRQFFTLFRDLRSPYITSHAAVYPGVTAFGDAFEPIHDSTVIPLNRNIQDENFVNNMREIVIKQAEDSTLVKNIIQRGENFAILAFASSGNPRHLLKTLSQTTKLNSTSINNIIREYYRTDIWSEHSGLADRYPGHRTLIDWGREFIENEVLPEIKSKNDQYIAESKYTTCFFWIHRDAPESVKEALRLLQYSGVILEHSDGIKATRSEIGTRYSVNLGCLFSLESTPTVTAFSIANNITPKRMSEYGSNYHFYDLLLKEIPNFTEIDMTNALESQMNNSLSVLDLTDWERDTLASLNLKTVGDVLGAPESKLRNAYYVGEVRARRIRNVAMAAVYEYLSG